MALRDVLELALDTLLEDEAFDHLAAAAVERRPEMTPDIRQLADAFDAEIARLCGMLYLLENPTTLLSIDRGWLINQLNVMAAAMECVLRRRDELMMQLYWQDEGGESAR